MRVNTNVSHRAQQQLVLDNFGGVDFSSSPLLMASNRASNACNLINDNGVNHKRPGWEEQFKLGGQVNGIYHYDTKEHNALIIYAGTDFYEVAYNETTQKYEAPTKLTVTLPDGKQLQNNRVQFYPQRDKVYIIGCGDYFVYGDFGSGYELKRVIDTDVYVPTTSIMGKPRVTWIPSFEQGIEVLQEIEAGHTLDSVNILTKKRKNTFIGHKNKSCGVEFYTDRPFNVQSAKITIETFDSETKTYKKDDYGISFLDSSGLNTQEMAVAAVVNFDTDYKSENDTDYANVTIEFEAADVDNEAVSDLDASAITGCRFGTLFGAGGASDRLFLSGNPDYPNADFYSEFDDYTYFTAQSQTVMGSDDVPITGYVRLSDSTLATMKAGAVYEPSIYYRKAIETDAYIDEEKTVKKIGFTKWSGGTGEACVSPYVIASLAEDDLILSPNGVFGIVEVNNAATNNRYMRERSAFINGKLLDEPHLSEATAFVYRNRYYLAVPTDDERNGAVYVADPRFKTYRENDIDGSFNYEWWYWENVPARVFAIIDGELWFGCTDGRVCRFDDKFTDRTYEYSDSITVNQTDENGNEYKDENGNKYSVLVYAASDERFAADKVISFVGNVKCDGKQVAGTYYIKSAQNGIATVCKYDGGDAILLSDAENGLKVKFHNIENVCSTWYTPVFSLGATDVLKTLLRMTISVDPIINGEVKFGYETRSIERLLTARVNKSLDFDDFSFEEFSFASEFATSYTVKCKARKFNYICFKFLSDNDRDCAINNFKAIYTLTASHRGVL